MLLRHRSVSQNSKSVLHFFLSISLLGPSGLRLHIFRTTCGQALNRLSSKGEPITLDNLVASAQRGGRHIHDVAAFFMTKCGVPVGLRIWAMLLKKLYATAVYLSFLHPFFHSFLVSSTPFLFFLLPSIQLFRFNHLLSFKWLWLPRDYRGVSDALIML